MKDIHHTKCLHAWRIIYTHNYAQVMQWMHEHITAANVLCTSMASPNHSSLLYIGGERHSKSSSKRIRRKRKKFVKRTWPWDWQRLCYSLYCTASVYWLLTLLASMKLNWVDTKEQVIEKERGIKIYTNKFLSLSVSLQLHLQYLKLTHYQ